MIDTHCHLTLCEGGLEGHLKRAKQVGIRHVLDPGIDVDDIEHRRQSFDGNEMVLFGVAVHPIKVKKYALGEVRQSNEGDKVRMDSDFIDAIRLQYPEPYALLGKVPYEVDWKRLESDLLVLEGAIVKGGVAAISEIGYEYFHNGAIYDPLQTILFGLQLDLAKKFHLPIFLHLRSSQDGKRNAYADAFQLVSKKNHKRGVLHCFSATYADAAPFVDLGFYVSFSGIVTFKNAKEVQETAKKLPLERILSETDAPYLAPHPFRGKPNECANLKYVNECLSTIRLMELKDINERLLENARQLLKRQL